MAERERDAGPDSTLPLRGGENPPTRVPSYVRATLRVLQGKDAGRVYELREAVTIIGRGQDADLALDDALLSRTHATVTYHERSREFRIADMKSENGTLLNGSRVTSYALRHNDRVVVGETLLVFEMVVTEGA